MRDGSGRALRPSDEQGPRDASTTLGRREILRGGLLGLLTVGAPASWLAGCGGPHTFVPITAEKIDDKTIDEDPLALLPAKALVYASVDLTALFGSSLGAEVAGFVQSLVPLGPESRFSPARDATRIRAGVYAMQGVDFCGVVEGNFDVAALRQAGDARALVPSTSPLVKTLYGPYVMYTVDNVGFAPLTARTMVVGNEIGMRRLLDRLRYGKVGRAIAPWMVAFGETKNASLAIAGELGAESAFLGAEGPMKTPRPTSSPASPILRASAGNYPFLGDLRAMRILGNFHAPGINLAGTLTYASANSAGIGARDLKNTSQLAQWASMFSSFGLGAGLPPIQVAIRDSDVAFVQPIDAGVARSLMQMMRAG